MVDRSLAPSKEELRRAKRDVTDLEDEETNIARTLEIFAAEKARLKGAGDPEAAQQMTLQEERLEERLERLRARRQELQRRITELENDVQSRAQEMRLLGELIDARLGLR